MKSLRLKTKFIAGFAALILLVATALVLFLQWEFREYFGQELHKRGISIARHLAETAVTPILTEDHITLQLLVNEYHKREEDVRYIYVIKERDVIVAHTFGKVFPQGLLMLDHPMAERDVDQELLQADDERIVDLAVPIHGDLGRVHVGVSEAAISRNLHASFMRLLPVVGVIISMGIVAALLFAASIIRPIEVLTKGARRVGRGELDRRLEVLTNDEIGELAITFNAMTGELQRMMAEQQKVEKELRQQTAKLEGEIAERRLAQDDLAVKQQQLAALNQSLEARVRRAVADLRQKDQMLVVQSRHAAMGEMINNIAHQWRQPLNNIGLLVQNLQLSFTAGELDEDTMAREVQRTMATVQFMSRTIDDFRSFFRQDKVKAPFSINRTVAKTVSLMLPSLTNNSIAVELEGEQEVTLVGYANEYAQVLLNILSNAKDVMLERGVQSPRIILRIFKENDRPVLTVRDNGGGIAARTLPRIFDPYFTTKHQSQGAGIGLYMSKVIIEQNMGGSLTARNVSGGAEFRIELPAMPALSRSAS